MYRGVDLTPERAEPRLAVDVLDYGDRRLFSLRHMFVIGDLVLSAHGRVIRRRAADGCRSGESDNGRKFREGSEIGLPGEAGDGALTLRDFQRVGDGGGVELAQMCKKGLCVHFD